MMRLVLTIFALICFLKVGIAQQVQILPPQVDNFGCTSISDLYSVTINNFESSTIEASMTLEIRYIGNSLQQGIVATGSLSAAPVFLLPVGNTTINSGNIDQFFPERDLVFLDPTLSTLNEQSACLPPGEYEVCIGLYRANTAGNPSPDNLISQTCYTRVKTSANNIFLVSPFNGEILSQTLPILTWTPGANFGAKSNYLLEIVEVFDYQTPYEAFRSNPLFYSQVGLTVNSLQYPMIARPFESCKRYAWRVGYYENDIFNNPGFTEPIIPDVLSDIWLFDTACNEIVGNDPSSYLPPNLLSPQNPVSCSQNGATLFMWSEANVPSNIVRYQLRIVQQDRVGDYNDILFSNEPLFVSDMTNEPFYYLQNSSNYLGELPCIWGVIPFDENNQPLFDNKALDAAPIYCGQFLSSGDDDCPLEVDQASLISKSYNATNDQWIIELSNPVTNEAALLSETSSIEINGVTIDVSPNISDWTTTIINSISWSSEIMNQSSETLTLALNREVNSSYGMKTNASNSDLVEVGNVLKLTIEKTIDQKDLAISILDSQGTILSQVCCGGVLDDVEDDIPTQLKMTKDDWTIDIGALRLDKYQEYEVRLKYRGSINAFRIQPTGQKNTNSLRASVSQNHRLKLFDNSGKPIRSVSNIEASNAEDGTRGNLDDRKVIRQKLKNKNVKFNRSGKQSYYYYYEPHLFLHNDDALVTEVVKVCLSKTFSSPTENCTGETCISVPLVDNTKDLDDNSDCPLILSELSLSDGPEINFFYNEPTEEYWVYVTEPTINSNYLEQLYEETDVSYNLSDWHVSLTNSEYWHVKNYDEVLFGYLIVLAKKNGMGSANNSEYVDLCFSKTYNTYSTNCTRESCLTLELIGDEEDVNNEEDEDDQQEEGFETVDCLLEITNFSRIQEAPIFRNDFVLYDKEGVEEILDFHEIEFLVDTNLDDEITSGNSNAKIFKSVEFTIEKASHAFQFIKMEDTQRYAMVPEWNANDDQDLTQINYEIEVCLYTEYFGDEGFECKDKECKTIRYGNPDNNDENCSVVINQYVQTIEPQIQDISTWNLSTNYNQLLTHHQSSNTWFDPSADHLKIQSIEINETFSSTPLIFFIEPDGNETPRYGFIPTENVETLNYDFDVCLTYKALKDGEIICSKTECRTISYNGVNPLFEPDDCVLEIESFQVQSGGLGTNTFITGGISGVIEDQPSQSFNNCWALNMRAIPNMTTANLEFPSPLKPTTHDYRVDFNVIETNAPSLIFPAHERPILQYLVVPQNVDNLTPEEIRDSIYFKVQACVSIDLVILPSQFDTSPDSYPVHCTETKCITISHNIEGETLTGDPAPEEDPCVLTGKITKKRRRNPDDPSRDMYDFDVNLRKHNPATAYTYFWEMSDGSTYDTDDVDGHMFPINGEDQIVKVTINGYDKNNKECEVVLEKDINARADCEYEACPLENSIPFATNFETGDFIDLCGNLQMELVDVTSSSPTNLSGTGYVYIPWLLTDIEVEYSGIKVNDERQFYAGVINANRIVENLDSLPRQWGVNAAYNIAGINNWVQANNTIDVVDEQLDSTDLSGLKYDPVGVPLGLVNKDGFTIAFDKFEFKPTQNFTQAMCYIKDPFGEPLPVEFYFASKNFFFNSSGPINNTEGNDLRFELIREVTVLGNAFGSCDDLSDNDPTNDDPDACLGFTFRTSDTGGWGTGLYFDSECDKMLDWCFVADMDIIMPRRWLRPVPDENGEHVITNLQMELCNWNDFIATIDLPLSEIPNTNGCQLMMTDLTLDLSTRTNVENMTFPSNFSRDQEYKDNFTGFYLKNATFYLPEGLSTFEDPEARVTAYLDNWIIDKKTGFTGVINVEPVIEFPTMQAVDMAASVDQLYFELLEGELKEAKMNGRITLPVCDYKTGNYADVYNVLDYQCLFGSFSHQTADEGLFFQVTPRGDYDCEFFANGRLQIDSTSNIQIVLGKNDQQSFDFNLTGELDFPDKEIRTPAIGGIVEEQTYPIQMHAQFQNLNLGYDKSGSSNGIFSFDKGTWSLASPQKSFNKFPVSITNFRSVTQSPTEPDEVYVGGIGFDLIFNLKEEIGGQGGFNILGAVTKEDGRLKPKFKTVNLDQVKVYADLPAVRLDGYLDLYRGDPMMGNGFAAGITAKFKSLEASLDAQVIFGNTFYNHSSRYRYWKAEAMFIYADPNKPGIPFLPGMEFRGAGLGAYNNMFATFPDKLMASASELSEASATTFGGATFTPDKGSKGFKIKAVVATSPKQEGFNGDFGIAAEWGSDGNGNTAGISSIGIDGNVFSGCTIMERLQNPEKSFLWGWFGAGYDFTEKEFSLGAQLTLNRSPLTGQVNLDVKANSNSGLWHFKLGDPIPGPNGESNMNTINVKIGNSAGLDVHSYFMFGNNIPEPPVFTPWAIGRYNAVFPEGNSLDRYLNNPSLSNPNNPRNQTTLMGAGFAFGLGAGVYFERSIGFEEWWGGGGIDFKLNAGFEVNASLLRYHNYNCAGYSPVGIKGWRASGSIILWLDLELSAWARLGFIKGEVNLLDIGFGAWVYAKFPKPVYLTGGLDYQFRICGKNVNGSYDFEYGDNCSGGSPLSASNNNIVQQDAAEDQRVELIKELLPENNATDFLVANPVIARYGFVPEQTFDVPELQSNGAVEVRTFKAVYNAGLQEVKPTGQHVNLTVSEHVNILNEYEYIIANEDPSVNNDGILEVDMIRIETLTPILTTFTTAPIENNVAESGGRTQMNQAQVIDIENINMNLLATANLYNQQSEPDYAVWPDPVEPTINSLKKNTTYKFFVSGILLEKTEGLPDLSVDVTNQEAIEYFGSNSSLGNYLKRLPPNEAWGGWNYARNNNNQVVSQFEIIEFETEDFASQGEALSAQQGISSGISPAPGGASLNSINP